MHGQPGSRFGNCIPTLTTCGKAPGPKDKVHLKSDIDRILSNVKLDRFQDVIMNEKLDEMDTMFMDGNSPTNNDDARLILRQYHISRLRMSSSNHELVQQT